MVLLLKNYCLVAPMLVCDADVIMGMDSIRKLGGVMVGADSKVSWMLRKCAVGVTEKILLLSLMVRDG